MNTWFFVDGANRGFVTELKIKFGEDPEFEKHIISPWSMKVLPVNFMTEQRHAITSSYVGS